MAHPGRQRFAAALVRSACHLMLIPIGTLTGRSLREEGEEEVKPTLLWMQGDTHTVRDTFAPTTHEQRLLGVIGSKAVGADAALWCIKLSV